MINLLRLFVVICLAQNAFAGLPPTTVKDSLDATDIVTFKFRFPNFTGSHSGVIYSLGVNSVAGGGTGLATLTANNVILGNGTSTPTFVAPGSNNNVLTSNGTTWTSAAPPAASLTIGSSAISGGTATRVLFEAAGPVLSDDSGLAYNAATDTLITPNVTGNTTTANSITITPNSADTTGTINENGRINIFSSQPTHTANESIETYNPTFTISSASNDTHNFINYAPTVTANIGAGAVVAQNAIMMNPTVTFNSGLAYIYNGLNHQGTFTSTAVPVFANTFNLFQGNPTMVSNTAAVPPININGIFLSAPIFSGGNAAVGSTFAQNLKHGGTYQTTGASGTMTMSDVQGFVDTPIFKANTAGGALTVTERIGADIIDPAYTATGNITVSANIGYRFKNQSQTAGNLTVTAIKALSLEQNVGTGAWNIFSGGTAASAIAGDGSNTLRLGDTTTPTGVLDIKGLTQINSSGIVSRYNNIATVSGGVPSELGTADLTAQSAAKTATLLVTPSATGLFRVCAYLQITRAATTSSILGGASGVVLTYNDGDGNVAQTNTMALSTTAGAIAITSATNTTATNLNGCSTIYARTGVAINYAVGYTSVGGTSMQWAGHLKAEAL